MGGSPIGQPSVSGFQPGIVPAPTSGSGSGEKKKWLLPVIGMALLLALGGAGYVFGLYLPNTPQTVFKKSLERSGAAADKLVEYAQNYKPSASSSMEGTYSMKSAAFSLDGTMQGESDDKSATAKLTANILGQKATVDMLMVDSPQSESPDTYFKINGLKQLLSGPEYAKIVAYDGQWIVVDHTILDSYARQSGAGATQSAPTSADITDAVAKAQAVNKQYIFTSAPSKAVITYKSFVGKETKNGREVNHYTASYSKANLKAYVKAMGTALDSSKLNEWVKQDTGGEEKSISQLLQVSSMEEKIDAIKNEETFDVYVDKGTKMIQSVVFSGKDDSGVKGHVTLAQNYTGGTTYPFEISLKLDGDGMATDGKIGLSIDSKTNIMKLNAAFSASGSDIKIDLTAKPSDKKLSVTAPTGAKSINDVAKQLGLDPSVLGSYTDTPSNLLNTRTQ